MTTILEATMRRNMSPQEEHLVQRLARETDTSELEARRTYERERELVDRAARIKNYVSVIAARHTREALRRRPR